MLPEEASDEVVIIGDSQLLVLCHRDLNQTEGNPRGEDIEPSYAVVRIHSPSHMDIDVKFRYYV